MNDQTPVGHLFTHVYQDRGNPALDSVEFRERLANYLRVNTYDHRSDLCNYLAQETGYVSPGAYQHWSQVLKDLKIGQVLNIVTLVWRLYAIRGARGGALNAEPDRRKAQAWKSFVGRALVEENVGYRLDDDCGAHYLVDAEFEHNRISTIRMLGDARYTAVRTALESAYAYLNPVALDTKAAVRSMFEALEIQARLMVAQTQNLSRSLAQKQLKDLAFAALSTDETARLVLDATFDAFGTWINGLHYYRHGQSTTEPVAPPLELAVHILATGSAYLRLLVDIDRKKA